jgi:hypothetical protein
MSIILWILIAFICVTVFITVLAYLKGIPLKKIFVVYLILPETIMETLKLVLICILIWFVTVVEDIRNGIVWGLLFKYSNIADGSFQYNLINVLLFMIGWASLLAVFYKEVQIARDKIEKRYKKELKRW